MYWGTFLLNWDWVTWAMHPTYLVHATHHVPSVRRARLSDRTGQPQLFQCEPDPKHQSDGARWQVSETGAWPSAPAPTRKMEYRSASLLERKARLNLRRRCTSVTRRGIEAAPPQATSTSTRSTAAVVFTPGPTTTSSGPSTGLAAVPRRDRLLGDPACLGLSAMPSQYPVQV